MRKFNRHYVIHVLEYLWKAAWCLHAADDPAAEDWGATCALALLAGNTCHIAATIDAHAVAAGLTKQQRGGIDACIRYLTGHAEHLRYDQALAGGWPIATGVIEGACRHLIGDRLEITGARWGLDGAEAILKLRAVIACGDFAAYWRYHLDREHHRIHRTPHQDRYTHRLTDQLTAEELHPVQVSPTSRQSPESRVVGSLP